jgi:hypothetical protein
LGEYGGPVDPKLAYGGYLNQSLGLDESRVRACWPMDIKTIQYFEPDHLFWVMMLFSLSQVKIHKL